MGDAAITQFMKQYGLPGVLALFMIWMYFNPSDQNTFRQDVMGQLEVCNMHIELLRAENETEFQTRRAMQLQIDAMQTQLLTFKSVQASLPWPAWIKDISGRVVYANAPYEAAYLAPRGYTIRDYVGHDDYAIWPKDVADEFRANDAEVIRTKQWTVFRETLPAGADGKRVDMLFAKYPTFLAGTDVVVGVAGIAVPEHVQDSMVTDPMSGAQWAWALLEYASLK